MKKSDKKRSTQPTDRSASVDPKETRRRTKLKPLAKEKYKTKQVYYSEEDDETEEINLFGYLDEN